MKSISNYMKTKLEPCISCGSDEQATGMSLGNDNKYSYYIVCTCGKSGDLCKTYEEAIKKWNERMK